MRRIGLAVAVTLSVTLLPLAVTAQSGAKLPRIGVLTGTVQPPSPRANALLAGLREFGYVDRQTVAIEWRPSGGKTERLPDLAAELVRLNVEVIVASDNPSIVAAQRVTKTIPIVMILALDPVGSRLVASLARPGGNITGLTVQSAELQGKSMQLLKEALPHVSRPAVLGIIVSPSAIRSRDQPRWPPRLWACGLNSWGREASPRSTTPSRRWPASGPTPSSFTEARRSS